MVEVTTIAITPAGSDLVSIVPFTQDAKISCGSIAQTLPQDLTGQVWRGAVRKEYSDSSPLLEFDFIVNPLLGLLTIKSPATITALLQSNAVYSDLPRDLQLPDSFSPKIWQNAYYWDAEYEMPAGDVYRAFQGRVWITPEATR